jgi:hypothetical protein
VRKEFIVWVGTVLLAGCALQVKPVHLQLPEAGAVPGDLKPIVLDPVVDVRDFEALPDSKGPRLKKSIIQELGDDGRAGAIFGTPASPLVSVLADRGTVANQMNEIISQALRECGYQVVDRARAADGVPHMSVRVTEFWAYVPFNLGRAITWTMQIKAWIGTDIAIKGDGAERKFTVSGVGANIAQVYSEENIRESYAKAIGEYVVNFKSKFSAAR